MIGFILGAAVVCLLSWAAHSTLLKDLRTLREQNDRLRNEALDRLLAKVAVESLEGHILTEYYEDVFGEPVVVPKKTLEEERI